MAVKTLSYSGESKTNLDLRAITEFIQSFKCSIADGKTELTLTYDNTESGTVLKIETIPPAVKTKKGASA